MPTWDFSRQLSTNSVLEKPKWQTAAPKTSVGWSNWDGVSTPTSQSCILARTTMSACQRKLRQQKFISWHNIGIIVIMELLMFHRTTCCSATVGRPTLGSCSSWPRQHGSVLEWSETGCYLCTCLGLSFLNDTTGSFQSHHIHGKTRACQKRTQVLYKIFIKPDC